MIDPCAKIGNGCVIGPNVTIGANCVIGAGCKISNTAIFENSTIGMGSFISHSIIGWNNKIGMWCHVENYSVFGDDVEMKDGLFVNEVRVLPNKGISKHCFEPEIIM